jgi:hypothetical protein
MAMQLRSAKKMKFLRVFSIGCTLVGFVACKEENSTNEKESVAEIFRDLAQNISVEKPFAFKRFDDHTQPEVTISEGKKIELGSVRGRFNNLSAVKDDVFKYSSWKRSFLGQDRSAEELASLLAITGAGSASVFPFERETANKGFLVSHSKLEPWARIWDVTEKQTVRIDFESKVSPEAFDARSLAAVLSALKWPDKTAEQGEAVKPATLSTLR